MRAARIRRRPQSSPQCGVMTDLRGRRDEATAVESRVACSQLVSEKLGHAEDRARLARFVAGLRSLVCSTKDASDELVERLMTDW
jgi:hypothetical protein